MIRFMVAPNAEFLVDNQTLYNVGDDWFKILLRMPYIPDVEIYYTDPDVVGQEVEYEPPEEIVS